MRQREEAMILAIAHLGETAMAHAPKHTRRGQIKKLPPFQYLLMSLVALLVIYPYVPQSREGATVYFTFVSAVLVTGVLAASVTPRRRTISLVLAAPTPLFMAWNVLAPAPVLGLGAMLAFLAFHVFITWSLIRTILEHDAVRVNTLYGAVCAYLLVGLSFATLYAVLDRVHPPALSIDSVRLGHAQLTGPDFIFFSFMTLTSVGYGDITPASPETRLVALFESVAGVFFMAFLVARLVAMYRSEDV